MKELKLTSNKIKLIIAGSRSIVNYYIVNDAFKASALKQENIIEIVSGRAKGVDRLGEKLATELNIPIKLFPANWHPNGIFDRSAGYKRNLMMANYADALLAIWDGYSKETSHMINIMKKFNKLIYIHKI